MLKKLIISGHSLIVGLAVANAGNVSVTTLDPNFDPAGSRVVVDANGLLPVGSGYVAVGTFTISDSEIIAAGAAGNWSALIQGFRQFGTAGKVPDFAGIVTHDASAPLADGDGFVGNSIYVAIGNTPAASQGDPTSANQWLVYKAPTLFGADNPVFGAEANLTNPTTEELLVGVTGPRVAQPDFGADVPSLRLAGEGVAVVAPPVVAPPVVAPPVVAPPVVIPEPSSALLLLSGIGSMIIFRRRR